MAFYNLTNVLMTSSTVSKANENGSIDQLLEMFKNKDLIDTMATSDKMIVTLFVAILGMTITFAVLMFLWFAISLVASVIRSIENKEGAKGSVIEAKAIVESVEEKVEEDDEELIVVIAAAVAASLNTSIHNIVVKNIVEVDNDSPSWAKTGRIQQMNTRF